MEIIGLHEAILSIMLIMVLPFYDRIDLKEVLMPFKAYAFCQLKEDCSNLKHKRISITTLDQWFITMASGLRPRTKIDYRSLNEGESLPCSKVSQKAKPVILDETYFVERSSQEKKQAIR